MRVVVLGAVRPVVERLVGNGPHRAAARLGAEIRQLGGTRTAADLVEQVARGSDVPTTGGAELSAEG